MNFKDQYSHPKWQKKRLEILERDGFKCAKCGDKETQLHVHHKYYEENKKVWVYEPYKLITLCESCHKKEHSNSKRINIGKLKSICNLIHEKFSCGLLGNEDGYDFTNDDYNFFTNILFAYMKYDGQYIIYKGDKLELSEITEDFDAYDILEAGLYHNVDKDNYAEYLKGFVNTKMSLCDYAETFEGLNNG